MILDTGMGYILLSVKRGSKELMPYLFKKLYLRIDTSRFEPHVELTINNQTAKNINIKMIFQSDADEKHHTFIVYPSTCYGFNLSKRLNLEFPNLENPHKQYRDVFLYICVGEFEKKLQIHFLS